MKRVFQIASCLIVGCAAAISSFAQASTDIEKPQHRAWDMLLTAVLSKQTTERTNGVRALGLLPDEPRFREVAEAALGDPSPDVRAAAATALGQMHATESIPKLQHALSDAKIPVVMAAAHSLRTLKDDQSAYEVYYQLLTGRRKTNDGLIAQQLATLKNPKELAKIGFSEGIGYVPFAGIGWDAGGRCIKRIRIPRELSLQLFSRTIPILPRVRLWSRPRMIKTGLSALPPSKPSRSVEIHYCCRKFS